MICKVKKMRIWEWEKKLTYTKADAQIYRET
jgi:hypothetical protein